MTPVATTFFFYFLAGLTVISGAGVILRRNAIHSALALIVALLGQAGLYLMLYAPFVAGVQIILYAGGIMVLFLFVIMLVNIEKAQKEEQFNKQWLVGLAAAVALSRLVASLIFGVRPTDPLTFSAVAATLISVGILANILPAYRATRIEPVRTLREE